MILFIDLNKKDDAFGIKFPTSLKSKNTQIECERIQYYPNQQINIWFLTYTKFFFLTT